MCIQYSSLVDRLYDTCIEVKLKMLVLFPQSSNRTRLAFQQNNDPATVLYFASLDPKFVYYTSY